MKAMYKIMALLFVLIIGMNSTAKADNNNYLSVENFSAEAGGQVVMPILMTNSEQIAAFQADLYLPSGVTLAEDEFGDGLIEIAAGRTTSKRHTVSYKTQSDGAIRIVVTSPNNNVFSGTSGAVVNITLDIASTIKGGTHTIQLRNQELTKTDLTAYKTDVKNIVMTIPGGEGGDDSGDISENFLSIANFTAEAGSQIVMPILMTNSEQIAAFQADLYLPSGVAIAEDEFGDGLIEIATGRTTSKRHTVSYKAQPDGAIRIVVTSPNNNVFSGTSGAVVNITLAVANSISSGTHAIMLNNQELTKTDLTAYKTATKSATITVASSNILVSSITFDKTSLSIVSGQTASLTATVAPADATNKNLTWTSSATSVATVSNGTITAVAPGTATITATAADGSGVKATCEVTVTKNLSAEIAALESLMTSAQTTCTNAVEGTAVGNYNPGAKATLQAIINEVNATISASMTEAQITEGTAKINNALATFEAAKVIFQSVASITLDNSTLTITEGNSATLTATIAPEDATNKTIIWTSSNEDIATVESGVVTAVAPGSATITATAADGSGVKAICELAIDPMVICDTIYYITIDGKIANPDHDWFDAQIVSNTYANGYGKIIFDGAITTIGEGAFWRCDKIQVITIPKHVSIIDGLPDNLTSVLLESKMPPTLDYWAVSVVKKLNIVVSPSSVDAYKEDSNWKRHSIQGSLVDAKIYILKEYINVMQDRRDGVSIGTNPGNTTTEKLNAFEEALNSVIEAVTNNSIEDFEKANPALESAYFNLYNPVIEGYYYIVSGLDAFETWQGVQKALYGKSVTVPGWNDFNREDPAYVWHITNKGDGFAITNVLFDAQIHGAATNGSSQRISMAKTTDRIQYFEYLDDGQWKIYDSFCDIGYHAESHSNGAGKNGELVTWNALAHSASAWILEPITNQAIIDEAIRLSSQQGQKEEIKGLIKEANTLYSQLFVVDIENENPLITQADDNAVWGTEGNQFLYNRKESTEGSYASLIDGIINTSIWGSGNKDGNGNWAYFHGCWSGVPVNVGAHSNDNVDFMQVDISKNPVSSFVLQYSRRYNRAWAQPTQITIYATNDTIGFYNATDRWTKITTIYPTPTAPDQDRVEGTYTSPLIELGTEYKYLRFSIDSTSNRVRYATFSEFQMYTGHINESKSQYHKVEGMKAATDKMEADRRVANAAYDANELTQAMIDNLKADIAAVKAVRAQNSDLYKIYYTSSDGNIITPNKTNVFGANIVSNTYENGQGVIEFDNAVTSIGDGAFSNCNTLTSIVIPTMTASIAGNAFGSNSLTSIRIPENVSEIGYAPFSNCNNLISISVDENNTFYDSRNNCNAIIESATNTLIKGCNNTIVPEGVTGIGDFAFANCDNLSFITLPETIERIGHVAFYRCAELSSIIIPESVTTIGDNAFEACPLTSIFIPRNVISIGDEAFSYMGEASLVPVGTCSLTSIIVDERNPIYDSRNNCNAIINTAENKLLLGCESTIIPDGVTVIGNSAFTACQNLTSISIPQSVSEIERYAFAYSGLKSVTIPNGVTSIDRRAFIECEDLNTVVSEAITPPALGIGVFSIYGTLHVYPEAVESYQNAKYWKNFTIVGDLAKSVTSIALNSSTLTITEGNTATLTATIAPEDASNKAITWTSSNEDVATVENGTITAVAPGTATITATAADGSGVNATCEVTVTKDLSTEIAALQTLVASAQTTCTNAIEGTAVGNYNAGAKAALQAVIDEVSATISALMTETQITEGTTKINNALAAFEAQKVTSGGGGNIEDYENVVFVEDAEGAAGSQIDLSVMLNNTDNISDVQFDLYLPAGVTIAVDEDEYELIDLSTDRTTSKRHAIDYQEQPDGSMRIMCTSSKGLTFNGNEGSIVTVTVNISDDMEEGQFPIILKNIVTSNFENTYVVPQIATTLTITNFVLGDINADGAINVGDLSRLAHMILNNYSEYNNTFKAADINGDHTLNVGDYSRLVQMILNATASSKSFAGGILSKKYETAFAQVETNDLTLAAGQQKQIAVRLNNNGGRYSAMQFDLTLPEGFVLANDAIKTAARTASFSAETNGSRVILHNMRNAAISGTEGDVLYLAVNADRTMQTGSYEIGFDNIILATTESEVVRANSFSTLVQVDDLTAIGGIQAGNGLTVVTGNGKLTLSSDKDQTVRVYTSAGALVADEFVGAGETKTLSLIPGAYIINNVKIAIK